MRKEREGVENMKFLKTKKVTKRIWIILCGLAITLVVSVFVFFFLQKKTYIETDLFITGGEWWWTTASPPYWLGEPVERGAVEYDISGKKIVEVLDVQKFDEPNRKVMVVRARLLVTRDIRTKKYRFKQSPLEIGATIVVSPGSTQMYANVIGMEGVQEFDKQQTQRILVRWFNVFPWQADAIEEGDAMTDNSGREVARIIKKEVTIAEKTIVTENNQGIYGVTYKQSGQLVIEKEDVLRRDVTLTIDVVTKPVGTSNFFGYTQVVKVGEPLYLSFPRININPHIISLSPAQ